MVQDAELHAGEDRERREKVEKHNALDSLVYQAEKTLQENGDKLPAEDKQRVESALADAKKDLESDDSARLDAARQRVEQELHKVAEVLYKSQAEAGGAGNGAAQGETGPPSQEEGEVVDAEYTEERGDDR
jgi:molecular chaperone DnaK